VTELSDANEKLRAQLSEKERAVSSLQMTVSSLEYRLSSLVAREAADIKGTPPVASAPGCDQGQDSVGETLQRIASQLIADGEDLDDIGETVDQVDMSTFCIALHCQPLASICLQGRGHSRGSGDGSPPAGHHHHHRHHKCLVPGLQQTGSAWQY